MITKIKSDFAFNVYLNGDLVGKSNNNAFSFDVPFGRQILSFEFADDTTRYARAINILQVDASNDSDTFVINLSLQDDKIIQTSQQEKSLPPQTPNTAERNENTVVSHRSLADYEIFSSEGRINRSIYLKISALNFFLFLAIILIEISLKFDKEAMIFRRWTAPFLLIIILIDILIANNRKINKSARSILIVFICFCMYSMSILILNLHLNIQGFASLITSTITTLIIVVQILNNNKRLHDLGHSGYRQVLYSLIGLILCYIYTILRPTASLENPLGMMILFYLPFLWLFAAKGDDTDNKYGPVV